MVQCNNLVDLNVNISTHLWTCAGQNISRLGEDTAVADSLSCNFTGLVRLRYKNGIELQSVTFVLDR